MSCNAYKTGFLPECINDLRIKQGLPPLCVRNYPIQFTQPYGNVKDFNNLPPNTVCAVNYFNRPR